MPHRRPVGALYAGQVQFVIPTNFNIINSMLFLSAVVLGGQGNKLGVIFGAFVIVYLPNRLMGVHLFGVNLGDLKYLFFGLALVVLMIFRPQGLFPVRQQLLAYGKRARELLAHPGTGFQRRPHDCTGTSTRRTTRPSSTRRWPPCTAMSTSPRAGPAGDNRFDRQVRRPDRAGR